MAKTQVADGSVILWTNGTGSAVASGAVVVVGQQLGVALVDIAIADTGSVAMEGVFTCPKVSGAVIAQGEMVIWDVSAGAFDDNAAVPATGDVSNAAIAWEAAGAGVTTLAVKLNAVTGIVA